MDNKKVTVLTPNGRRQNMTISPSTTILHILEGVCTKHGFNSDEYDLKHYNRVLDPSTMFRFSGLPNNCFLEMVESSRKREPEKDVELCIQLEDGSRRQGSFPSSENLFNILQNLCSDKTGPNNNPVFIYMRKDIFGDDLQKTTLKSLGITARAMIRLIDRNPEDLKIQASVSVPLPKDAPSEEDAISKTTQKQVEKSSVPPEASKANDKEKTVPKEKVEPATFQLTPGALKLLKGEKDEISKKTANEDKMETEIPGPSKKTEYEWGTGGRSMNEDQKQLEMETSESEDEEMLEEPQVIELGERNAVIFSLAQAQKVVDDLPDSFFELTTEDLRLILKDLRKQGTDSDEPLLTAKLRELQEQSKILTKMDKYKKSVIRIQFPDRLVLQGTFKITETMKDVCDFVKEYLADSSMHYHLFTTPPKKVPDMEKTLIELDFVPTVVLHFAADNSSAEEKSFLKPEFLSKLSSPNGATLAASKSRGRVSKTTKARQENNNKHPCSKGAIPKKPKPDSFRESKSTAGSSSEAPKWFKAIKK